MKILIDVDETVADFVGALQKNLHNHCPHLDNQWIADCWDWFRKDEEVEINCNHWMEDWKFWSGLEVLPEAKEGIAYLRSQGHELIWCTMPYKFCFGWLDARREWLCNQMQTNIYQEPLITVSGGEKYLIRATTIIDDRVPFVEAWEKKNNSVGFVMASPINVGYHRRYTWGDIKKDKFFLRKIME